MKEPIRIVTDPYGNRLPKNKICLRCEARPRLHKEKYCDDCVDIVAQETDEPKTSG